MILIVGAALLTGLIGGLARGGSLARIGDARLRWLWLAPVAFGAQLAIVRLTGAQIPEWVPPVHLASYVLLLAVVAANARVAGLPVIGLGLLMNTVVIGANGGLMPITPELAGLRRGAERLVLGERPSGSKDILLERHSTRLWWLSDHLVVPSGGPTPMVVSPGDLVLAAGTAATVYGLMRPSPRRAGRREPEWSAPSAIRGAPEGSLT